MHWLERAPILVIGLLVAACLILAHEFGFRIGRAGPPRENEDSGKTLLVSSALALQAFLLAFTFEAAQVRFNLRQQLVVVEANAVSSAYLRFQLLDQPWRDALGRQMLQYAEVRARFARAVGSDEIAANSRETDALQDRIWPSIEGAVRANPGTVLNGPLVQSVTDMFDLAATRRAATETRIPITILRMMAIYAVIAAWILGFSGAPTRRYGLISSVVLVLLALAFCLVLDLDRPSSGSVQVRGDAMERTLTMIRQKEAAKRVSGAQAAPQAMPSR